MNSLAKYFDESQLQLKAFLIAAIYQHYGWMQQDDGNWVPGPKGREFEMPLDALVVHPKTYFHSKNIGGDGTNASAQSHDFFNTAQSADSPYASNFTNVIQAQDTFSLITGISLEVAIGASASDADDIKDYALPFDGEIVNGLFSFDINGKEIFKDQPVSRYFLNDDPIPGLYRLPIPTVWEPGNKIDINQKLADTFGSTTYRYAKWGLHGFELGK